MSGGDPQPRMTAAEAFRILGDRSRQNVLAGLEQARANRARLRTTLEKIEDALEKAEADPHAFREIDVAGMTAFLDDQAPGWRHRRTRRQLEAKAKADLERYRPRFKTIKGEKVVRVPLHGRHRSEKSFLIDAGDWQRIAPECGEHWILASTGTPLRSRVISTKPQAVAGALRLGLALGKTPLVPIARLVLGSDRWATIRYVDGDPRNVRRANLEVVERRVAADIED